MIVTFHRTRYTKNNQVFEPNEGQSVQYGSLYFDKALKLPDQLEIEVKI